MCHTELTAGPQLAHMTVFVLPPSESCSSRVSLESRYGMCCDLPSTRAEMTLPRAERDMLILVASLRRSPEMCVTEKKTKVGMIRVIGFAISGNNSI